MGRQARPFWYRDGWYTDAGGGGRKLLAKGKENYAAAEHALHVYLAEMKNPRRLQYAQPHIGLTELVDLYLDQVKAEREETTYKSNCSQLRRVVAHFGNVGVFSITAAQVLAFRNKMLKRRLKNSTINICMRTFRSIFLWGKNQGIVDSADPTRQIKPLPEARRERLVGEEEYKKLLEAAARLKRPDVVLLLQVMRVVPLRPGEARALRWEHTDWSRRLWILRRHKTRNRTRVAKPRIIAFPESVERLLKAEWDKDPTPGGFIFHPPGRPCWATAGQLSQMFRRLRHKAGIRLDENGESLRLYSNRHTVLTEAARCGANGPQLQMLAGWTNLKMTEYYIHLDETDLRKIADKVADVVERKDDRHPSAADAESTSREEKKTPEEPATD